MSKDLRSYLIDEKEVVFNIKATNDELLEAAKKLVESRKLIRGLEKDIASFRTATRGEIEKLELQAEDMDKIIETGEIEKIILSQIVLNTSIQKKQWINSTTGEILKETDIPEADRQIHLALNGGESNES